MSERMKLRWSDGHYAEEFEVDNPDAMEAALANALIAFRLVRPRDRAELHVLVDAKDNRWTDPALRGRPTEDLHLPALGVRLTGGYTHVIHLPGREPDPDSAPRGQVRGTDWILIIGPGGWHGGDLYVGCQRAVAYYAELSSFLPRIVGLAVKYKEAKEAEFT